MGRSFDYAQDDVNYAQDDTFSQDDLLKEKISFRVAVNL